MAHRPFLDTNPIARGLIAVLLLTIAMPVSASDRDPSVARSIDAGLDEYIYKLEPKGDEPENKMVVVDAHTPSSTRILGGIGLSGERPFTFPSTLADLRSMGSPVLISGGYSARVGSAFIPLGYLKTDGTVISSRIHRSWLLDTMACINAQSDRLHFERASESDTTSHPSCLQTGPWLFKDGGAVTESPPQSGTRSRQTYMESPYVRLFMCKGEPSMDDDFFGITDRPVTMLRLLEVLPELAVKHKHICRNMVELAGNTAAGMLIKGELVAGSDSFLLTSAILLTASSPK